MSEYICLSGSGLLHSGWFFSTSVHLPVNFKVVFFLSLSSTPLCNCTTFSLFILQDEGHLGCFQVLTIMNNAAMNRVEQMSL